MSRRFLRPVAFMLVLAAFSVGRADVSADEADLFGDWYGVGAARTVPVTDRLRVSIVPTTSGEPEAFLDIPILGIRGLSLPVTEAGDQVTIGVPGFLALVGVRDGDMLAGTAEFPSYIFPYGGLIDWQLWRDTGQGAEPGPKPSAPCEDLPALYCLGTAEYCGALVPFEPVYGPGYANEPENGETWDDQYRSYLRRDLRQLIQYATAKVACLTAHWDTWPFAPLGLVDMSEADGSVPGTSVGYPGHPPGTHEDGRDIDLAYYQLFAPDNRPRVIGDHFADYGVDEWHLVAPPPALDVWRTALLIAALAEHPRLRVVGVDGQAGLLLEDALDQLVEDGWIDEDLRANLPLAYEVEDQGRGWFRFHHHHLHVSLVPLADVVAEVDLKPEVLNKKSRGKMITAYVELTAPHDVEDVDVDQVALLLDGHTRLVARKRPVAIGDRDGDGNPDLMVKFDRGAVLEALSEGTVEVSLTGVVGGLPFQGTDTVRVR